MKETLKLALNWLIPLLCVINMFLAWGNAPLFLAWMVASAGWISTLISYFKYEHNYVNKNIH